MATACVGDANRYAILREVSVSLKDVRRKKRRQSASPRDVSVGSSVSDKPLKRVYTRGDVGTSDWSEGLEVVRSGVQDVSGCTPLGASSEVGAGVSVNRIAVYKSPESKWTEEDPAPTIDRVCALGREDLVAWTYGWLNDLEAMRGAIPNLEEQNSDKMRQQIAALKRTFAVLDSRAARADELVSALGGAEK